MDFFTHDEKDSACWRKLVLHLEEEKQVLINRLCSPSMAETETAVIRGEIKRIKKTLDLAKVKPVMAKGNIPHYDT